MKDPAYTRMPERWSLRSIPGAWCRIDFGKTGRQAVVCRASARLAVYFHSYKRQNDSNVSGHGDDLALDSTMEKCRENPTTEDY